MAETALATSASRSSRSLVWAAFVIFVVAAAWYEPAYDLAAEYVAARLVASHQAGTMYNLDSDGRARHLQPPSLAAAAAGGIPSAFVTPYVHTPLWAWLLSPLAAVTDFSVFKRLFAALDAVAAAAMIFLAARQWAPRLTSAGWQAVLLAGFAVSVPFAYSIALGQLHVLALCVVVYATVALLRGNEIAAGGLLAAAACVKITPVWVALTWVVAGRWRAVWSFAASSLALSVLTLGVAGWDVFSSYLRALRGLSGVVLLSFNNDSLATLLLGGALDDDTAFHFKEVSCPLWVSLLSLAAITAFAVIAGRLDRRHAAQPARQVGSILILVAATAGTPLAWNHYYIVLILPVILFLHEAATSPRGWRWMLLAVAVALLNLPPFAYAFNLTLGPPLVVIGLRSHFWAAMLCLAGVLVRDRGAPARAAPTALPA